MRKLWIFTLCGILSVFLAACTKDNNKTNEASLTNEEERMEEQTEEQASGEEMENQWVTVDSIEAAQKIIKIDVKVPEKLPEGYEQDGIRVLDNTLVEITYTKGEEIVYYRVSGAFSEENHIGSDWNEYSSVTKTVINDTEVAMYGEGEIVKRVDWGEVGYYHSAYSEKGMTEEEIRDLVESIQ